MTIHSDWVDRFTEWCRFKFYGGCMFPGEEPCNNAGIHMYQPLPNSRPIYLCPGHLRSLREQHKVLTEE
jgi:hypothetical protein